MRVRNLVPFTGSQANSRDFQRPLHSLHALQREVNRIFDEVWHDLDFPRLRTWKGWFEATAPRVDVSEDDQEFRVTAELPGLDENDVEVTLCDGVLTIRGEKKAESEDEGKRYYLVERSYGAFQRTLPIGNQVRRRHKVAARFENDVLTVSLPKSKEAKEKVRRSPIRKH